MEKEQIISWVQEGPRPELLEAANKLGNKLGKKSQDKSKDKQKLTTSQIRQVFTRLKSIEAKGYETQKTDFLMLKPYLAYAAARHNKDGIKLFKEKITVGIDAVFANSNDNLETEKKRFANFCKLFEAILAYHRAAGGQ